jgi:hypothetical protein
MSAVASKFLSCSRNLPSFTEPEVPFLRSQERTVGPYPELPELLKLNPHDHINFL